MSDKWRDLCGAKLVTAAEALKAIRPGNRVFIGSACGEPQELVRAMTEFGDRLVDTEVIHVLTLGVAPYAESQYAPNFRPSRELFDYMNDNPQIEMHPSEYTNHPGVISGQENMVAINAALEVDLTGQVVADSLGQLLYSGIGGHADFIRGAALAKNGKPIIAMPSTADTPEGVTSRIVATLQEGAGVITTRGDTHYIVTEYGVAYLHGKTMRERAMSLLSVAHPDFRAELLHGAKQRRIVYSNQIMPPSQTPYPSQYEEALTLRSGETISVRPIRSADEPLMREMFYHFSENTKYLRFHAATKSMPHNKLQVFCTVDYGSEMALIGLHGPPGAEEVVGIGRYMADSEKHSAEVAFTVSDAWQRKGLGTYFFERLVHIAREHGIQTFDAYVLVQNSGMLKIFHGSGLAVETTTEGDVVRVTMKLPEEGPARDPRNGQG